jgi:vacuolar-type H+-ATPase subunit E/Vma4
MSLERLVEEVRRRSESELEAERASFAEEARKILAKRDDELKGIAQEAERSLALETARIQTTETARAKVEGRKLVFEARQRAAERSLQDARRRLGDFTGSPEYAALLKRLYRYALQRLGKPVRVFGRPEDAAVLKTLAGKGYSAGPVAIAGGVIAESSDGSRRLDLSFGELLRRREDDLLDLARTAGAKG